MSTWVVKAKNLVNNAKIEDRIDADSPEIAKNIFLESKMGMSIEITEIFNLEDFKAAQEKSRNEKPTEKKCPKCAESIKIEAEVCRFCNYSFVSKSNMITSAKLKIAVFGIASLISLGFVHIIPEAVSRGRPDMLVVLKENFSYKRTFVSVEGVIEDYNSMSLGDLIRGDANLFSLVKVLKREDFIAMTKRVNTENNYGVGDE